MLTAKGDEASRIQGLEQGADDYGQAVQPRELLARIRAVLRRQAPQVPGAPASETRPSPSASTSCRWRPAN